MQRAFEGTEELIRRVSFFPPPLEGDQGIPYGLSERSALRYVFLKQLREGIPGVVVHLRSERRARGPAPPAR